MSHYLSPKTFRIFKLIYTSFHFWTVFIAYKESGILTALVTFFIPLLGEIYWFFAMMGENWIYVIISAIANLYAFITWLEYEKDKEYFH